MIIRRASRFGSKAGFDRPFLAPLAETVIERYGSVYAELDRNRAAIMQTLTSEEERFRSTVDSGVAHLMTRLEQLRAEGHTSLDGATSSGLYTTYGLPLEITRDIAREHGLEVDEAGFHRAMEAHRLASGAGALQDDQAAADETQIYGGLLADLQASGKLGPEGVSYDPYSGLETEGPLLALVCDGRAVEAASPGERVAVVLPATHFYVESGGQVSDTGTIVSTREPRWEIRVQDMRRPVAGMVAHIGEVVHGMPRLGDTAIAAVDAERRWDIMRNHTATHLLHASLRALLGQHARQAGSLVAPDRLRFDFTHPRAVTAEELERIEAMVNDAVLANHELDMRERPRGEAVSEGAMALFGETYGETVRTISIGDAPRFSYELCGGTHVPQTGVIGPFVILSESSVAAGIRRIEAATGRAALGLIRARLASLSQAAARLGVAPEVVESRVEGLLAEREELVRQVAAAQGAAALDAYRSLQPQQTLGVAVLTGLVPNASAEVLRELTDRFRTEHPTGVAVLASAPEGKPVIVAAVSQDLVARGLHAGEMVKAVAAEVGGGGGGKPQLAQAGGKDPSRLPDALRLVPGWIEAHLR
jgi:alanyl-tRNA synthetase